MIPVNRPSIPRNSRKYLNECTRSGWFSSEGPFVKKFEQSFANYLGVPYATTTSSGTAALHLAVMSLGIGKDDEVIVPALTIASCYFAVWYTGAKAVPVDVTEDTYTLDPQLIESAITTRTKAIMVVHLFGHPCDMDPIMNIARKYKLAVIEDAAEAHGAEYKGKKVGTIGDVGIFSFYANKIVTTGEGGMVVTAHNDVITRARKLKSLNHSDNRFIHDGIGYNYLMSNMQAAVGLASLEEIETAIEKKRKMAALYTNRLAKLQGIILPIEKPWAKCVYWMYAIRVKPILAGFNRDALMEMLWNTYRIQTRSFFNSPKTAFPGMKQFENLTLEKAELFEKEGFYVPSGLGNSRREFFSVIKSLEACCGKGDTTLSANKSNHQHKKNRQ